MAREVAGVTGFGNRVEAGVQALVGLGLSLKAQARVKSLPLGLGGQARGSLLAAEDSS